MFTNAYKPIANPGMLDWIRITGTENFTITKHVAEYAKRTKVGVNFNLCEENEHQLLPMLLAARDAGVQYFQVRPALADRADLQQPVALPDDLAQYETDTFRVVTTGYKWEDYLKPHVYPICHGHRFVPFVWHNGDVSVCAYHFGREPYILGDLRDGGFKAVWESEKRHAMMNVPVIHECQHNCKNHEINKSLATLRGERVAVTDEDFL
jgi:sulfatase maturation enzyme AslB (radical SAM superfamily)